MQFTVASSPHLTPATSVSAVMLKLLLALLPGVAVYALLFGWGILLNLVIGCLSALVIEALFLFWRNRPVKKHLGDYTAIVTAVLLVLALPPLTPWWLITLGVFFALSLGKHVYGGLGYNPFNPAMVGYVIVLISFPTELSFWPGQLGLFGDFSLVDTLQYSLFGSLGEQTLDGISSATVLAAIDNGFSQGLTLAEIQQQAAFGLLGSAGFEWIALAYLAGGLWLIQQKVIRWQIPAAIIATVTLLSAVLWLVDSSQYASPLVHLLSGAVILGAFFIATDPVSASTTRKGRLWFGAGIGVLIVVIRSWGGYPDGVAFAVLLMNIAVPMIDYYTQPRVYGHSK